MHVPIDTARAAREQAQRLNADCAVAVGGGSTIGLGKAIALESNLPILAIPTTYAGSEMTPIYGITEGGLKKTGRDARVLPKTVIYDPTLTLGLPAALVGDERNERDRACGRRPVRAGCESDHLTDGARRDPRVGARPCRVW